MILIGYGRAAVITGDVPTPLLLGVVVMVCLPRWCLVGGGEEAERKASTRQQSKAPLEPDIWIGSVAGSPLWPWPWPWQDREASLFQAPALSLSPQTRDCGCFWVTW